MTSLRERLERKIASEAEIHGRFKFFPGIKKAALEDFKAGANSLLPLVCELAEALEKYSHEVSHGFCAREALQSIEKFVEGKK